MVFIGGVSMLAGFAFVRRACDFLGEMNIIFCGIMIEAARTIAWGFIR